MNYKGETPRQKNIQFDIELDLLDRETEELYARKPWREVDKRKAYIEKRMRMEGLN